MAQEYSYSCSACEKSFPVTVKQAGMAQNCPFCSAVIDLPGMREIRQLPPLESSYRPQVSRRRSESRAWLFSGGLLVGVLCGLLGWALMVYADKLVTESVVEQQIEFGASQIHLMPAGHLWDAWDSMTENGLPDWEETVEVRYNKQAGHLSNIAYGLFGASGLGLLALISSFFVGGKK